MRPSGAGRYQQGWGWGTWLWCHCWWSQCPAGSTTDQQRALIGLQQGQPSTQVHFRHGCC